MNRRPSNLNRAERPRQRPPATASRRGGAILVLALFGVGLLLSLVLTAATTVRLRWIRVEDLLRRQEARDAARSAFAEALHVLADHPSDVQHLGEPWADPQATPGVRFTDESARLHLPSASTAELQALLALAGGLAPQRAMPLAEAIHGWRAARAEPPRAVEALREVPGMDAATYARIAPHLTVFGSGRVNLNTVEPLVFDVLLLGHNLPGEVRHALRQGLRSARGAGVVLTRLDPESLAGFLLGPRTIPTPALVRALSALAPRVGLQSEYLAATATGRPPAGDLPAHAVEAVVRRSDLRVVRWTDR